MNRKTIIFSLLLVMALSQNLCADELDYIKQGAVQEERGNFIQAIDEYNKALVHNPKLLELYISIGNIYHQKLNDNKKASETYLKGLEIDPYDFNLNMNIMYLYFTDNDVEKGIKYYEILSKINKDNTAFSFTRDIIDEIFKNRDEKKIVSFCNRYLDINPTDNILREKLAAIYKRQKKYDLAEQELRFLLDHGYKYSMIYFELGVCNYHLGEYVDSLNYLNKAKELGEYVPEKLIDQLKNKISEDKKK